MKNQNIVIASNGKVTYVMVDGKVYGDHVVKVEFIHDHKDKPNDARLLITTDCVPLEGDASDEERLAFMKRVELLSELQGGGVRRVESTIKVHEDEVCIKTEKTEITHTKEAISVSAPKINLESDKLSRQL